MYLGHLGIGLWAKARRPSAPLWLWLTASQGPDWFETFYRLAGANDPSLLSHGFPGTLIGSTLFTLLARTLGLSRRDTALVTLVYASHLAVDFLTGLKPTWPGGPHIGLFVYQRYPRWDFPLEAPFLIAGWLFYRASLAAPARRSFFLYLLLLALLIGQGAFSLVLCYWQPIAAIVRHKILDD